MNEQETAAEIDIIIGQANAGKISRYEMVERLKGLLYTWGAGEPYPFEGYKPGTIDQLGHHYYMGNINASEYTEVYDNAYRKRKVN